MPAPAPAAPAPAARAPPDARTERACAALTAALCLSGASLGLWYALVHLRPG